MERRKSRFTCSLQPMMAMVMSGVALVGCAMSERGPDAQTFVHQVRQALGQAEQLDVAVSQLIDARWQQLCMHREGSLTLSLIEIDNRHVVRVPYRQLSVVDGSSPDSLDGKCVMRNELVRLRRQGSVTDGSIVIERISQDSAIAVASNAP